MRKRGPGGFEGPSSVLLGRVSGLLPAEAVEFPVPDASEKGMPFIRGKSENRSFGVPAVTDADLIVG
jgi:hypothetical protein